MEITKFRKEKQFRNGRNTGRKKEDEDRNACAGEIFRKPISRTCILFEILFGSGRGNDSAGEERKEAVGSNLFPKRERSFERRTETGRQTRKREEEKRGGKFPPGFPFRSVFPFRVAGTRAARENSLPSFLRSRFRNGKGVRFRA